MGEEFSALELMRKRFKAKLERKVRQRTADLRARLAAAEAKAAEWTEVNHALGLAGNWRTDESAADRVRAIIARAEAAEWHIAGAKRIVGMAGLWKVGCGCAERFAKIADALEATPPAAPKAELCRECGHKHRRGAYVGSCEDCSCPLVCVCPQECEAHPEAAP